MQSYDVVIIGGGPAGRSIVHTLHSAGSGLSILVIKDEAVNVNRCAVPYGITAAKPVEKYQIPNSLVTDFGAELLVDTVTGVSTSERWVETERSGRLQYRKLVFATGARPWVPPIPGVEADNVTAVRSLADLECLRNLAGKARHTLVVGAGYIGVEVACVMRGMGLDVTLVEAGPHILPGSLEPEFVSPIGKRLASEGIRVVTDNRVTGIDHEGCRATGVRLENGDGIDADCIVLALGVRPNVELAKAAGLATSRFGVVVDARMQAGVDGVFAAGDCVEARSVVSGQPVNGDFGTNAVFMSRVVAANLLGRPESFPGVVNASSFVVFDFGYGAAGLTEAAARSAGIDVVSGMSEVLDRYPMMDGVTATTTKLVFERASGRLVGGAVLRRGTGAAQSADFLSLAIQMGATTEDLMRYQYATHPELAAKPSDNAYVFAARDAMRKHPLPATGNDYIVTPEATAAA